MKLKIALLCCLAFSIATVKAQKALSISGTVRDEKHLLLPGATVFLTGTKSITASDNNGFFHLDNIAPGERFEKFLPPEGLRSSDNLKQVFGSKCSPGTGFKMVFKFIGLVPVWK